MSLLRHNAPASECSSAFHGRSVGEAEAFACAPESPAFQYPLVDGDVEKTAQGKWTISSPLDGSVFDLQASPWVPCASAAQRCHAWDATWPCV